MTTPPTPTPPPSHTHDTTPNTTDTPQPGQHVFVLYTDPPNPADTNGTAFTHTTHLARTPNGEPAHPTRVEQEVITELTTFHIPHDNEPRLTLIHRSPTHPASFDVHIYTPWLHLHQADYDPGVEDFESHIGDYLHPTSLGDGNYLFTDPEGITLFTEQFHRGTHWLLNCDPTSTHDPTSDAHHHTNHLLAFYHHYLTHPTIPPAHAETITATLNWWNQQPHP